MSLYEFLYGAKEGTVWRSQFHQLQALKRVRAVRSRQQARESSEAQRRIKSLEEDVGFLALVIASLLETLDRKGVVTREEARAEIAALDDLDGVKEGRLDVRVLRERTS